MGQPNGDDNLQSSPKNAPISSVSETRTRGAYKRPDDDWQVASPVRRLVHLLAAFHEDVAKELPPDGITPDTFAAWWRVVDKRDWRDVERDLEWIAEFVRPLLTQLHLRTGRGARPPMIKILEEAAAERLPHSEPSLTFRRYHLMRPDVYEQFKQLAEEKLQAGFTRYSSEQLLEEIRGRGVKHGATPLSPEYARKLMREDLRFTQFFRLLPPRRRPQPDE